MNSFTNTILTLMLGWLSTFLNVARKFISSDSSTTLFDFFRYNWRIIFLVLCIGGFALDKIVYLIRWRPSPIWIRRHARRARRVSQPEPVYDPPMFDEIPPAPPMDVYEPEPDDYYADAAPTMQYQMRYPQDQEQPYEQQPQYPVYDAPQFAPEASRGGYTHNDSQQPWDDAYAEPPYAPAPEQQQRFAFGMPPSFGSAQSEPTYGYPRDTTPSFAPPQFAQEEYPVNSFAPPSYYGQTLQPDETIEPTAYQEPSPFFRPFSDRGVDSYAPQKAKGLGVVAKKARDLLGSDEAYDSLTYQDLQPTVDVSKAFHSPVYPEKKPEGDQ